MINHIVTRFILTLLERKKIYLVSFLLISIIWATEMSVQPYLLKQIIESMVKNHNDQKVFSECFIFIGAYIGMSTVLSISLRIYHYLSLQFYPAVRGLAIQTIHNYLLQQRCITALQKQPGGIVKRIRDLATHTEIICNITIEMFFPRTIALLAANVMLYSAAHPAFCALLSIWTMLYLLTTYVSLSELIRLNENQSWQHTKLYGFITDSIDHHQMIQLYTQQQSQQDQLTQHLRAQQKKERTLLWAMLKLSSYQAISVIILIASIMGAVLVLRSKHDQAGTLTLVIGVSISFINATHHLGACLINYAKSIGICRHILETFYSIPQQTRAITNPDTNNEIAVEVNSLLFSYHPNSGFQLKIPNLRILHGEKIAIIGPSGSGKSTFAMILSSLLFPSHGSIKMKKSSTHPAQSQISYLPQQPQLLHRSVIENIRFGRNHISKETIISVCKQCHCHAFIMRLDQQYDTIIGKHGAKLSLGQQQRIALARLLVQPTHIIILDEATAQLDTTTENVVLDNITMILKKSTIISITHKTYHAEISDRVIVLNNGSIISDGTPNEVLFPKQKRGSVQQRFTHKYSQLG